jgi:uncharacterized protein with HEPN domain
MKKDYLDYVEDIIEAMNKAEKFVEGLSYELFAADDQINFAVVRALEIIGEAAKRVPQPVCTQYPQVPWSEMAGMRDKLIHGYDDVNLELVWQTVKNRIPLVKPALQQLLDDQEKHEAFD